MARERQVGVNKSKLVSVALAAWLVLEIAAFVIVVQLFGVTAAVVLGVGTTLLGLADVRRLFGYLRTRKPGAVKAAAVKAAAGKAKTGKAEAAASDGLLDGGLHALASLLLILPGFASDLVGLALKAPSIRASVADRIRGKTGGGDPRLIDLAPNEWKTLSHSGPKRRKPKTAPDKPVAE